METSFKIHSDAYKFLNFVQLDFKTEGMDFNENHFN